MIARSKPSPTVSHILPEPTHTTSSLRSQTSTACVHLRSALLQQLSHSSSPLESMSSRHKNPLPRCARHALFGSRTKVADTASITTTYRQLSIPPSSPCWDPAFTILFPEKNMRLTSPRRL